MAGLLEQLVGALTRFEAREETEHDVRLFKRYGKVNKDNRTVKFHLESIAKKTQLNIAILSTRLSHGAGMSASTSDESKDWFSGLSTTTRSKRSIGLVRTGPRYSQKLNGHR